MSVTANPSVLWLGTIATAAALTAIFCAIPILLVLASYVGLAPFDFGILVISVPVAGIAVPLAIIARTAARDLMTQRPVLTIDDVAIHDRRVSDQPIPWSEVTAATSILTGHGGIVLEVKEPLQTRLEPFRPGTFLFSRPDPGVAHIPLRAMTVPAGELEEAILGQAARHGVATSCSHTHPGAERRRIF